MTTNAQAALQAAATIYSTGRGNTSHDHVTGLAETLKKWLDKQDQAEPPRLIEYDLPFGQGGAPLQKVEPKLATRYTMKLRPRNSNTSKWFDFEVIAVNADEALSKALSQYPGHTWGELTDTEEKWEQVGPYHYRRAAE